VDDGTGWSDAELAQAVSDHAWREWAFRWDARRGRYTLCVRATDSEGTVQPGEQQWNFGGYGNNMIQRVDVIVE
jgi:hypothetical protein